MIGGRGSKKGPLDGVGVKLSAADIKKWFTHPVEMEAKLEKKPKGTDSMANALQTKGIEPAEVDALVAYMQTLTKKEPQGEMASDVEGDRTDPALARNPVSIGGALVTPGGGTYKNQSFHVDDTGCFRCHSDTHTVKGDAGKKVRQDCETLPQAALTASFLGGRK